MKTVGIIIDDTLVCALLTDDFVIAIDETRNAIVTGRGEIVEIGLQESIVGDYVERSRFESLLSFIEDECVNRTRKVFIDVEAVAERIQREREWLESGHDERPSDASGE